MTNNRGLFYNKKFWLVVLFLTLVSVLFVGVVWATHQTSQNTPNYSNFSSISKAEPLQIRNNETGGSGRYYTYELCIDPTLTSQNNWFVQTAYSSDGVSNYNVYNPLFNGKVDFEDFLTGIKVKRDYHYEQEKAEENVPATETEYFDIELLEESEATEMIGLMDTGDNLFYVTYEEVNEVLSVNDSSQIKVTGENIFGEVVTGRYLDQITQSGFYQLDSLTISYVDKKAKEEFTYEKTVYKTEGGETTTEKLTIIVSPVDIDFAGENAISYNKNAFNNDKIYVCLSGEIISNQNMLNESSIMNWLNTLVDGVEYKSDYKGSNVNVTTLLDVFSDDQSHESFSFSSSDRKPFSITGLGEVQTNVSLESLQSFVDVKWYEFFDARVNEYECVTYNNTTLFEINDVRKAGDYRIRLGFEYSIADQFQTDFEFLLNNGEEEYNVFATKQLREPMVFSNITAIRNEGMNNTIKQNLQFFEFDYMKKDLKLFESGEQEGTININKTTEFRNSKEASSLFSTNKINSSLWAEAGGIQYDYNSIEDVVNHEEKSWVDFSMSEFYSSWSVGKGKTVDMVVKYNDMAFNESEYEQANIIMSNYNLVAVTKTIINEEVVFVAERKITTGDETYNTYRLSCEIEIILNTLKVDAGENIVSSYSYGEINKIKDFSLDTFYSQIGQIYLDNWTVVFCNGELLENEDLDSQNVVYIVVNIAYETESTNLNDISYCDENGVKYKKHTDALYYSERNYFLIFEVYVALTGTSNVYKAQVQAGECVIFDNYDVVMENDEFGNSYNTPASSASKVVKLSFADLAKFNISKKKLVLFRDPTDTTSHIKTYDGNNTLDGYRNEEGQIVNNFRYVFDKETLAEEQRISYENQDLIIKVDARFSSKDVGPCNVIVEWTLASAEGGLIDQIVDSYIYEIDESIPKSGQINKAPLGISFVNADVVNQRNYREKNTIAVRVAKSGEINASGGILSEDKYAIYLPSYMSTIFVNESDLIDYSNVIKVEFNQDDFITNEGFTWDRNNANIMDYNGKVQLDFSELLSWFDSVNNVDINQDTLSNTRDDENYYLEFNNSDSAYLQSNLKNYYIVPQRDVNNEIIKGLLHINKLEFKEDFCSIDSNISMTYGSASVVNLFEFGILSYTNHSEYSDLAFPVGNDRKNMVEIIAFYDGKPGLSIGNEDVQNMELPGTYDIVWTIPSTNNYQGAIKEIKGIKVSKYNINSIMTSIIKEYSDEMPVNSLEDYEEVFVPIFNDTASANEYGDLPKIVKSSASESTADAIQRFIRENGLLKYVDNQGNISDVFMKESHEVYLASDGSGGYTNTIYYFGLTEDAAIENGYVGDYRFSIEVVVKDTDNVGRYDDGDGINAINGVSDNYNFINVNGVVIVLQKALSITAETNQSAVYSSHALYPNYDISNGDGVLRMVIKKYNNLETNLTEIIDVGVYEVDLYAKPNINSGTGASSNYKETVVPITVSFSVTKMEIVWGVTGDIVQDYNPTGYTLKDFDDYYKGSNDQVLQSSWGSIEVLSLNGNTADIVNTVIDVDTYTFSIKGHISNSNIGFMDTQSATNELVVVIQPSALVEVIFTAPTSASETTPGDGSSIYEKEFTKVYDAIGYVPTYSLSIDNLCHKAVLEDLGGNIVAEAKNVAEYVVTILINDSNNSGYNANFSTITKKYLIKIKKAKLVVSILSEEDYNFTKSYLEEIDDKKEAYNQNIALTGWIEGDDVTSLEAELSNNNAMPIIDWGVLTKESVVGDYIIFTKDNPDAINMLANYEYQHVLEESGIVFSVLPAKVDFILEENYVYTGEKVIVSYRREYNGEVIEETSNITIDYIDIDDENNFVDVGSYQLDISVGASSNFEAIDTTRFDINIIKADLEVIFEKNFDECANGYNNKIYDRDVTTYPIYKFKYTGFVGKDDINTYKNAVFNLYNENTKDENYGIVDLGLIHPSYGFYNEGEAFNPTNVGEYSLSLSNDVNYVFAKNYNVKMAEGASGILEITKRKVGITNSDEAVEKVYNLNKSMYGNNDIPLDNKYYVFTAVEDDVNSGLIIGDEIKIKIDYARSEFARINVLDDDGKSEVDVYVKIIDITNDNYELIINSDRIATLKGDIKPATAVIKFMKDDEIINAYSAVYNGSQHTIDAEIFGVNNDILTSYIVKYSGIDANGDSYSNKSAPINAGSYRLEVTVSDTNYTANSNSLPMSIDKNVVTVVFSGNNQPKFGDITNPLVAVANGIEVAGKLYTTNLEVTYKNVVTGEFFNKDTINNADVGEYEAITSYEGAMNYKPKLDVKSKFNITPQLINLSEINVNSWYNYDGTSITIDNSFTYASKTYHPVFNYYEVINGEYVVMETQPLNAGLYRVKIARDGVENFVIESLDGSEISKDFEIKAINTVITLDNVDANIGERVSFSNRVSTNIEDGFKAKVNSTIKYKYIDLSTSLELSSFPTKAGKYTVTPYGVSDINYIITYKSCVLTLNNSNLSNSFEGEKPLEVELDGSFEDGVKFTAKKVEIVELSKYNTMYDSFISANTDYAEYKISSIINMMMIKDNNVITNANDVVTFKIYAKDYFDLYSEEEDVKPNNSIKKAGNDVYYVAQFIGSEVVMIEAQRDGDYLIFESDKVAPVAILINNEYVKDVVEKDDSWILYVGIGVGVLLIAIALIIIKKRA